MTQDKLLALCCGKIFKKATLDENFSNFSPDAPLKLKREVPYTYFCTKTILPDPNVVSNWWQRQRKKN